MFNKIIIKKGNKEEGEKPFWISFADLMSALMILFLVVMCASLLSVTRSQSQVEQQKKQRDVDISIINNCIDELSKKEFNNIHRIENRINFGKVVSFESGKSNISIDGKKYLRSFIPKVLNTCRNNLNQGQKWIKQIVVEGYTDIDGSYLYNLNLSLKRSQSVICALFDNSDIDNQLSDKDKMEVRDLFSIGGYSFNSVKESKEESRRVELKMEFWSLEDNKKPISQPQNNNFGMCNIYSSQLDLGQSRGEGKNYDADSTNSTAKNNFNNNADINSSVRSIS